jgi:predicted ATPase/DNA-binding CsgD family transcriptional regulator
MAESTPTDRANRSRRLMAFPSRAPSAAHIPAPLTSFIGRDQEVAAVAALLARPDIRLLTVTGPGGIGKTRLALQIAADLVEDFPDGVVFIPLASIRDPELVLTTVAQVLSVPDASGQSLPARLQAFLQDRHLLLILDNFEHLMDAVPPTAQLLGYAPRLKVLVTSRTRLMVSGEHTYPLPSLAAEEARQLFTDRAQGLVPTPAMTNELTPIIDAICTRLDRLPLAIELAVAWIPVLPPHALLARLEHRLDLLTGGPRDAPARLRDMRGAIAWSLDLLGERDQRLFRRLGVFVGGFTLEAADAVAGESAGVLAGVRALVSTSLVNPMEAVGDEPRFTMLETIREFAVEQLAALDEELLIQRRHAEYYQALAEAALPHYDGPELRVYRHRVTVELDNCRAAMAWALDNGAAETGVRLAGALWRIWWTGHAAGGKPWTDRVAEGRSWCERMLAIGDHLPVEALTEALIGVGFLATGAEELARMQAAGEDLLARAQIEDNAYGIYWAHQVLGKLAEVQGPDHIFRQYGISPAADAQAGDDVARHHYEAALAVAPTIRNPDNYVSLTLTHLGVNAQRGGDLGRSATLLDEALSLCRSTNNPFVLAMTLVPLGQVLREQGQLDRAIELLREALVVLVGEQGLGGTHVALIELALVAEKAGCIEHAAHLLGAAATLPESSGYRRILDGATARARMKLEEATFTAAWETGTHLSWDDVLVEVDALATAVHTTVHGHRSSQTLSYGLSLRELEILRLLVEGHSNRAIGALLSVSQRTVENHVRHILTKLDLESRTAAATFAVRNGLV